MIAMSRADTLQDLYIIAPNAKDKRLTRQVHGLSYDGTQTELSVIKERPSLFSLTQRKFSPR